MDISGRAVLDIEDIGLVVRGKMTNSVGMEAMMVELRVEIQKLWHSRRVDMVKIGQDLEEEDGLEALSEDVFQSFWIWRLF
ncbi:hypothetical protein L6452_15624 [Arctium lappa]|uniref:Uncharacterized protein n=1 Tax=Arctium lappa TaxID=4217 RepID=A0ACB9CPD3_ARCLA|nr:hypothetical protein L6452_15624 [Arctium lappa]